MSRRSCSLKAVTQLVSGEPRKMEPGASTADLRSASITDQLCQGCSAGHSATTVPQSFGYRPPGFTRSVFYGTGFRRGPLPRALPVREYPSDNVVLVQGLERVSISNAAILRQQPGQRRSTGQPTRTFKERVVHPGPRLLRSFRNGSRALTRPLAGSRVVSVSPLQNLINLVMAQRLNVPDPALTIQKLREGTAAGQPSPSSTESCIDGASGFFRRLEYPPGARRRPLSDACSVGIGPLQNLRLAQIRRSRTHPDAAAIAKQLREGTPTGQTSVSLFERPVDPHPGLIRDIDYRTGPPLRPTAGLRVMSLRPLQDKLFRERWSSGFAPRPPSLAQKPSQR